jgi:hypothetical protein
MIEATSAQLDRMNAKTARLENRAATLGVIELRLSNGKATEVHATAPLPAGVAIPPLTLGDSKQVAPARTLEQAIAAGGQDGIGLGRGVDREAMRRELENPLTQAEVNAINHAARIVSEQARRPFAQVYNEMINAAQGRNVQ